MPYGTDTPSADDRASPEIVEVTQADREAATSFFGPGMASDLISQGKWDEQDAVLSYARHRIAERERCAAKVEATALLWSKGGDNLEIIVALMLSALATAIRTGEPT